MDANKLAAKLSALLKRQTKTYTITEWAWVKKFIGSRREQVRKRVLGIDLLSWDMTMRETATELVVWLEQEKEHQRNVPPPPEGFALSEDAQNTLFALQFSAREVRAVRLPENMRDASTQEQVKFALKMLNRRP